MQLCFILFATLIQRGRTTRLEAARSGCVTVSRNFTVHACARSCGQSTCRRYIAEWSSLFSLRCWALLAASCGLAVPPISESLSILGNVSGQPNKAFLGIERLKNEESIFCLPGPLIFSIGGLDAERHGPAHSGEPNVWDTPNEPTAENRQFREV